MEQVTDNGVVRIHEDAFHSGATEDNEEHLAQDTISSEKTLSEKDSKISVSLSSCDLAGKARHSTSSSTLQAGGAREKSRLWGFFLCQRTSKTRQWG